MPRNSTFSTSIDRLNRKIKDFLEVPGVFDGLIYLLKMLGKI